MSYFKNLSRLVSRNSQSSQASKEEVSPPSSGTTTSKASYGDPRRTDTPPPSIPEDARKTPEIRRRESLGVRMSSVINSSSKRKSEDKGSKRTRRDSSTPNRVNTHEIWSLQAPTPTTETTTRPISPPVSSRPPTPAIARPASPAVRHKESRLRLVHRGESAKSVLLKEKEHLTTRVHELTEQVHTLEERERTYQARCSNLETDLDRATSKYRSAKGDLEALLKEHNAAAEHTARHIQELTAQKQKVEAQLQQYEATAQVARQYQDLKVRYQQLDSRNQHLETRNQQAEAEVQQLRDQLRVAQSTAAAAAAVVQQQPSRQVQDLRTRNQQLEAQLHQAQAQLRQYESKHSETTALLDVRTAELKGAQAFLTKADSFSGADIIRMVEGLNSEIFQCCALVAETVFSEENIPKEDEKFVAGIRTELAGMHGEMLISFLAKNAVASRDPLPLQVALQMLLIKFCIHVVTSFDLDNAELNERLSFIYEQVVNTGV
ncbi:hypothetical protein CC1G_14090 [Coprinopsis cinerea okayama7|uniref:Uncharacterized protein n=1 Tax=Coprinopsis cinerea (strain Okayama-7 / 130 / ATCC MYA-4618 / FGSC 9003) TaxID=240176 RepID=D6RLA8_COPC7|nr:hypothetical protein CC1G_14090 [Coprinopsis cinerea okayama7\|eukprot:XP_002911558.1 hypothetical protein CC1G_14090 [Coprinopsis cinerea okayama7\